MLTIFMLNWMFSMMFLFMNHPLSLGCILLIQTILISLVSGYLYYNFWFGYILFLIMIGGMLVMFIYMTSIASNEKFKMPKFMLLFCLIILSFISIMFFLKDNFYSYLFESILSTYPFTNQVNNFSLSKYFHYPSMYILISLMIYIFITLTAKIIGKNPSTLRQK